MTIAVERSRAVAGAREFLRALLDPRETPRVPRAVRQRALRCLRHYPGTMEMKITAEMCPRWWEEEAS
jgi:hypothetical protein